MGELPFEVDDAVVLVLGAPSTAPSLKDRVEGVTRLEKLLFLLERETPLGSLLTETPDFKAHHFGPFSARVYQAVESLAAAGLVEDSATRTSELLGSEDAWEATNLVYGDDAPYTPREFELTPRGRKYYSALVQELPAEVEGHVSKLKNQFGSLPLRQLIRYVYTQYPDFTTKSKIRDDVLGR